MGTVNSNRAVREEHPTDPEFNVGYGRRLTCDVLIPARDAPDMAQDVLAGLGTRPMQLPPKYFYDDYGSVLFDQICDTPEYYPTRTEDGLLKQHADQIMADLMPVHVLELGSGSSRKTRHLLAAADDLALQPVYWPLDVCEPMLRAAGEKLTREFAWLQVRALVGDYHAGLDNLPLPESAQGRLFVFLGGTLGNFEDVQARAFLAEIRQQMSIKDHLLLGVDRLKPRDILHAAYNDEQGLTARFNKNLLSVINRELDGDFDPDLFLHRAAFNRSENRIEMYLQASSRHSVRIGDVDLELEIEAGESIMTEISRKFDDDELAELFAAADLNVVRHYQDEQQYYSLILLSPASQ